MEKWKVVDCLIVAISNVTEGGIDKNVRSCEGWRISINPSPVAPCDLQRCSSLCWQPIKGPTLALDFIRTSNHSLVSTCSLLLLPSEKLQATRLFDNWQSSTATWRWVFHLSFQLFPSCCLFRTLEIAFKKKKCHRLLTFLRQFDWIKSRGRLWSSLKVPAASAPFSIDCFQIWFLSKSDILSGNQVAS